MTRPATLSEAADRVAAGVAREIALAEFLDTFYTASSPDERLAMLLGEPRLSGDARLDALLGAIGEYLAKQYRLASVPSWIGAPSRVLAEPWFTGAGDSDAMREYLSLATPAEFLHHNIFTDSQPLRRASQRARPATASEGPADD